MEKTLLGTLPIAETRMINPLPDPKQHFFGDFASRWMSKDWSDADRYMFCTDAVGNSACYTQITFDNGSWGVSVYFEEDVFDASPPKRIPLDNEASIVVDIKMAPDRKRIAIATTYVYYVYYASENITLEICSVDEGDPGTLLTDFDLKHMAVPDVDAHSFKLIDISSPKKVYPVDVVYSFKYAEENAPFVNNQIVLPFQDGFVALERDAKEKFVLRSITKGKGESTFTSKDLLYYRDLKSYAEEHLQVDAVQFRPFDAKFKYRLLTKNILRMSMDTFKDGNYGMCFVFYDMAKNELVSIHDAYRPSFFYGKRGDRITLQDNKAIIKFRGKIFKVPLSFAEDAMLGTDSITVVDTFTQSFINNFDHVYGIRFVKYYKPSKVEHFTRLALDMFKSKPGFILTNMIQMGLLPIHNNTMYVYMASPDIHFLSSLQKYCNSLKIGGIWNMANSRYIACSRSKKRKIDNISSLMADLTLRY